MQLVYPREMPKEQIPWDVNVGSGQEYVVKAGTTLRADALGGFLFYIYGLANLNVIFIC